MRAAMTAAVCGAVRCRTTARRADPRIASALLVLRQRRLRSRLLGCLLRRHLLLRLLLLLLGGLVLLIAGARGPGPEQRCHRRADPDQLLHGDLARPRTAGRGKPSAAARPLPAMGDLPVRRAACYTVAAWAKWVRCASWIWRRRAARAASGWP